MSTATNRILLSLGAKGTVAVRTNPCGPAISLAFKADVDSDLTEGLVSAPIGRMKMVITARSIGLISVAP